MAQQTLNWYTRTYPNFFEAELCDAYVQTFEETMEKDKEEVFSTSICYGESKGAGGQPICGNCNCQRMNPMGFDRFIPLNKIALNQFLNIVDHV